MKLKETIKRVLKEEEIKPLIYKILRRLDLSNIIDKTIKLRNSFHKYEELRKLSLDEFINIIIDDVWYDYITYLFDDYNEVMDSWETTLTKKQTNEIKDFIRTHYEDKIKDGYEKRFH